MRLSAHERYQNDPMFARIVDVLYTMLITADDYGNKQYTATEMREAAMVACEKYEYLNLRPTFIVNSAGYGVDMFGGLIKEKPPLGPLGTCMYHDCGKKYPHAKATTCSPDWKAEKP
jgi:hypothetical protein